jgi:hypothetical protein
MYFSGDKTWSRGNAMNHQFSGWFRKHAGIWPGRWDSNRFSLMLPFLVWLYDVNGQFFGPGIEDSGGWQKIDEHLLLVHMNSAGLNFGPQTCHDLGSVCHELDILRARSPQPWHLAVWWGGDDLRYSPGFQRSSHLNHGNETQWCL